MTFIILGNLLSYCNIIHLLLKNVFWPTNYSLKEISNFRLNDYVLLSIMGSGIWFIYPRLYAATQEFI